MTEPYVLDIDMKQPTYVNEPVVKQRDDITIVVNLLDNGLPYDFTDSTTLTLTVARLDKVSVTVGGTQTNDNQITFKVPRSAVSVIGRAEATIQIYGSDGRSSSTTFFMSVQRDPSSQSIGEGEKTLIEVVLGEGPAIIEDAQTAAVEAEQAAIDATQATVSANTAADRAGLSATYIEGKKTLIEKAITDSGDAKTTADTVRDQFDQVIAEAGSNNPEVVQARGTFTNLNQRLDSTAQQLADKADKKYSVHPSNLITVPSLNNVDMVKSDPGPRFTDFFNGKMWGYKSNGEIHWSIDEGRTWNLHTKSWNPTWGFVSRILPTGDGEVLVMGQVEIRKSIGWDTGTVTWSANKVVPNGTSVFNAFGLDGYDNKFILTEYGSSIPNWSDSRFVYVSLDYGNTFSKVFDTLEVVGAEDNPNTHLHGACYDRWGDRFYFSQGHGVGGGLYYSINDGVSWHQGAGHRDGVLASGGIVPKEGDTNGPTVLIATPKGLVMGSDNRLNGLFGMLRKENPEDEVVTRTYAANYSRPGLIMFAQRAWLDEATGTAYVTFRSEFSDVPPIICAGTPTKGGLVYEYPSLPVVGASDRYAAVARVSENRLVVYAQFGSSPYTMRGDLTWDLSDFSMSENDSQSAELEMLAEKVDGLLHVNDSSLETTIPRYSVTESASTGVSGTMSLTYFTAQKTETINKLHLFSGTNTTAPTLVRFGIYEVKENGDLVLVSSSANNTSLLSKENNAYSVDVSIFNKVRGKRYAIGSLVIATTNMPTLYGVKSSSISATMWSLQPRMSGGVAALSDIPETVTANNVGISGRIHYYAMT